ncbi:MAG: hypothetical protein ACE5JG_05085 [Planctomycetota bacterium]
MIRALCLLTVRECNRRPFPFAAALTFIVLALLSMLFLGYSFGQEGVQARHLALSAVFLGGLAQAVFVGATLIRTDLQRGTLSVLLTTPVLPSTYIIGRYLGLVVSSLALCAALAAGVALLFLLLPLQAGHSAAVAHPFLHAATWTALGRTLLLVAVFDAAALAASAGLGRTAAPLALFSLFLGGSLHPAGAGFVFLPDWTLFVLDHPAPPPAGLLAGYALVLTGLFLVVAYILLGLRPPASVRG